MAYLLLIWHKIIKVKLKTELVKIETKSNNLAIIQLNEPTLRHINMINVLPSRILLHLT
ncbi:MAG: hypothetical protein RIR11_1934 [Bacteroidota bacterium]|jgi:hypothetical protein